jgi:retron-type reverse transcriptase
MSQTAHGKPKKSFMSSTTIDDYRCKLINKILFATSQEEVKRFVAAAMKGLQQHKVNGYVVARFINKMLQHLEEFKHSDHNAQQCNNIEMARISFSELKISMYGESVPK